MKGVVQIIDIAPASQFRKSSTSTKMDSKYWLYNCHMNAWLSCLSPSWPRPHHTNINQPTQIIKLLDVRDYLTVYAYILLKALLHYGSIKLHTYCKLQNLFTGYGQFVLIWRMKLLFTGTFTTFQRHSSYWCCFPLDQIYFAFPWRS